jgi:hypothetical protein
MREPRRVAAGAGYDPGRYGVSRLLDSISILLASSYLPTVSDDRFLILDISQFNNIDLAMVKAFADPQVKAMNIRIGGSASVVDTKFEFFWGLAKALDLLRSMYVYNWPGWSVDLHIANLMRMIEDLAGGDLGTGPIWVDAECHAGKTKAQVSNHTINFIEAIERELAKLVGWYTGPWFIKGWMQQQDWMKEKLAWLAEWLYNQPKEHPGPIYLDGLIIPRSKAVEHQTGSNCKASIFGGTGRVDTNRWEASPERFAEIYGAELEPEPEPEPDPPGLAEQVHNNTKQLELHTERLNIIDEFLRSYDGGN